MTDSVLNILKVALLGLLYLFFARVLWAVWSEVRGPRPGTAPAQASAKAASGKSGTAKAAQAKVATPPLAAGATDLTTASPVPPPPPPAPNAAPQPTSQPAPTQGKAKGKPKSGRKGQVGRLIVLEPRVRKGTAIGLAHEVTFGRAPGCTVSVPDDSYVSQVHARVYRNGEVVIVEDVGSTNGTYVNGNRITTAVVLRPGDRIQFGTTVLEAN
jgi:hypothetical protein